MAAVAVVAAADAVAAPAAVEAAVALAVVVVVVDAVEGAALVVVAADSRVKQHIPVRESVPVGFDKTREDSPTLVPPWHGAFPLSHWQCAV